MGSEEGGGSKGPESKSVPSSGPRASDERRAHRRFPVSCDVQLQSHHGFAFGWSADLSTGGVRIETTGAFPPGTEVRVSIQLPDGKQIQSSAEVVRTKDDQLALRFLALDQSALEAILSNLPI